MNYPSFIARTLRFAAVCVATAVSAVAAQAQSGSVAVRVTETNGGRPVDQAQVLIIGTTLGGVTNSDGRFIIRGIPVGNQTVRVLRVGFSEVKRPVAITAGQQATMDVTLDAVAVSLAPVVTTATGDQRRVEIGNAVSAIDAS
ncbi:MAG: carboxypeptidase regulatory-like domain-containing protein, partial [Gemmatimonadaceae bacterium]